VHNLFGCKDDALPSRVSPLPPTLGRAGLGSSPPVITSHPIRLAPSSSPNLRAHSHSPSTCESRFTPLPRPLLGRQQPPGSISHTPSGPSPGHSTLSSFREASALHLHVQILGRYPPPTPTHTPPTRLPLPPPRLGLRPPRLGRAPRSGGHLATPPPALHPSDSPPRARHRSAPTPLRFLLLAPPSLRGRRGPGPERARRRSQCTLGLLWPLPRATANHGERWCNIVEWSLDAAAPRAGAARRR
jgi:hypothetical protein